MSPNESSASGLRAAGRTVSQRASHAGTVLLLAVAALALAACDPGGAGNGPPTSAPATITLRVATDFDSAGGGATPASYSPFAARGELADVAAVGVEVRHTPFASGAPVTAEIPLTEVTPGVWEGTLTGLPVGVSLDFRAIAYNGPFSAGVNLNLPLFSDQVTRTLTAPGPNDITFRMASIDDGVQAQLPTVSIEMPSQVQVNQTVGVAFTLSFPGPVDYAIGAATGLVSGSTSGIVNPTTDPRVDILYTAPGAAGLDTLTITLNESGDPANSATYRFPVSISATATGPVTTLFGPTIIGLEFARSSDTLTIGAVVTGGALPYSFAWSGTGSFASLASTTNPATISPFSDADSGDVTATVTDANGISAQVTYAIVAGEFPYTLILVDVPPPPTITFPATNPYIDNAPLGTLSGTCEPLSPHTVNLSGQETRSEPCVGGIYTFTLTNPPVADGSYVYTVTQTHDATGQTSLPTSLTFIYDTTAPAPVAITTPSTSPFTSPGPGLLITGDCEAGAVINVSGDASQSGGCPDGRFSIAIPDPNVDGTYTYDLTQTDAAGNTSSPVTQEWIRSSSTLASALPLFDDFSGPDPETHFRWQDTSSFGREIIAGELVLSARGRFVERTVNNPNNHQRTPDGAGPYNRIEAKLTPRDFENVGGQLRALIGLFYQPPADRAAGCTSPCQTNLSGFRIGLIDHGNGNGLQIDISNFICTNSNCSTFQSLPQVTGNIPVGQVVPIDEPHTFTVEYDAVNDQFLFDMDGVFGATLDASGLPIFNPADFWFAGIRSEVRRVDQQGERGNLVVAYDDVRLNGGLYDDFSGASIDRTLWRNGELVRDNRAGQLVLAHSFDAVQGFDTRNNLRFRYPRSIDAMAADVTVTDYFNSTDGSLRARIGGFFFNDGTTTGVTGDNTGDIFATVGMTDTEVDAFVVRCNDANCTTFTQLDQQVLGSVTLGSTHTLYLGWDGTQFTYQLDSNAPVTFNPAIVSPQPTNAPFKALRTQVSGATTGDARIYATFDNVRVGPENLVTYSVNGSGPLELLHGAVPLDAVNPFGYDPIVVAGAHPDNPADAEIGAADGLDCSINPDCDLQDLVVFTFPADFGGAGVPILGVPMDVNIARYSDGTTEYVTVPGNAQGTGTVTFDTFAGIGARTQGSFAFTLCLVTGTDGSGNDILDCGTTVDVDGTFDTVYRDFSMPLDDTPPGASGSISNPVVIEADWWPEFTQVNTTESSYYRSDVEPGREYVIATNDWSGSHDLNVQVFDNPAFGGTPLCSAATVGPGNEVCTVPDTHTASTLYIQVSLDSAGPIADYEILVASSTITAQLGAAAPQTLIWGMNTDLTCCGFTPDVRSMFQEVRIDKSTEILSWTLPTSQIGFTDITIGYDPGTALPGDLGTFSAKRASVHTTDGSIETFYRLNMANPGTVTITRYDPVDIPGGRMEGSFSLNVCQDSDCTLNGSIALTGTFSTFVGVWGFVDNGSPGSPLFMDAFCASDATCDQWTTVVGSTYMQAEVTPGTPYVVNIMDLTDEGYVTDQMNLNVFDSNGFAGTVLCNVDRASSITETCEVTPTGTSLFIRVDHTGGGPGSVFRWNVFPLPATTLLTDGIPVADTLSPGQTRTFQFPTGVGQTHHVVVNSFGGLSGETRLFSDRSNWNGFCCVTNNQQGIVATPPGGFRNNYVAVRNNDGTDMNYQVSVLATGNGTSAVDAIELPDLLTFVTSNSFLSANEERWYRVTTGLDREYTIFLRGDWWKPGSRIDWALYEVNATTLVVSCSAATPTNDRDDIYAEPVYEATCTTPVLGNTTTYFLRITEALGTTHRSFYNLTIQ